MENKIKYNDLRIGNFILYSDQFGQYIDSIITLGHTTCQLKNDGAYFTYEGINPILLTEEWLLKFGFEKYEFDHKDSQYRYNTRLIVIRENKFVDYGSSVTLEYVHQLQNIYFALTGKELE